MFDTLQLDKEIFPEKFILRLINYIFPTKCLFENCPTIFLTELHDFESNIDEQLARFNDNPN